MTQEFYMARALELAKEAAAQGDVPVGCVIVSVDGRIVGEGKNCREVEGDAVAHAEIQAITMACRTLGGWRLPGTTLYVTLEPCPMCAGAILNARIGVVHYGAREQRTGACGSVLNLFEENFGHHPALYRGPLEKECAALLQDFFAQRRKQERENF